MSRPRISFAKPPIASMSRKTDPVEKWIVYRFCDHIRHCSTCRAPFRSVCSTGWTLGLQLSSFFFVGPGKALFSTIKDRGCHVRVELPTQDHEVTTFLSTLQQMSGGSWSSITGHHDRWHRSIYIAQEKHFTALFKYVLGWL